MSYEEENKKAEKINKQGWWRNVGLAQRNPTFNNILITSA